MSLTRLCAAEAATRGEAETLLIDAAPEVEARPDAATLLMEPLLRRTGLPVPEDAREWELSGLRLSGPSGVARSSDCALRIWTDEASIMVSPTKPPKPENR